MLYVLLVYVSVLTYSMQTKVVWQNVECGLNIDYIETDPGKIRYYPFVVELYHSHESNNNSSLQNKECFVYGSIEQV